MDYKIIEIKDNVLTLLDEINLDEWGHSSSMQFIMDDTSCFKVGDAVKITIVKRYLTT